MTVATASTSTSSSSGDSPANAAAGEGNSAVGAGVLGGAGRERWSRRSLVAQQRRGRGPWSPLGCVMAVLVAVVAVGARGIQAAAASGDKSCIRRAGDYQVDLGPLMDDSLTLQYKDPGSDKSYLATVCGSYTAGMVKDCPTKLDDVVAAAAKSCEYYGRASREEPLELIDAKQPQKGVKLKYKGGGRCVDPIEQYYSVTYLLECDPTASIHVSPRTTFVGVQDKGKCEYEYRFKSKAACPVYSPPPGGAGGGGGGTGHIVGLLVVVVLASAYCLGGSLYKSRVYGSSGLEMVPHIDLIRRALIALRSLCLLAVGAGTSLLGMSAGGGRGVPHKYSQTNPGGQAMMMHHEDMEVIEFQHHGNHHHTSSGGASSAALLQGGGSYHDDDEEDDVKL